jgi:hypothetical protein
MLPKLPELKKTQPKIFSLLTALEKLFARLLRKDTCVSSGTRPSHWASRLKPANLPPADARVAKLLSQVSVASIQENLDKLTGITPVTVKGKTASIRTRNTFTKGLVLAIDWLEEQLVALVGRANVERVPYEIDGGQFENLIVNIHSNNGSNEWILVGAHLDSTAGDQFGDEPVAPGADDDGSGVVAQIEMIKLLLQLPLQRNIRLMFFTGEEQGLDGSTAYAQEVKKQHLKVLGMIQSDMIADTENGKVLQVWDSGDKPAGSKKQSNMFLENFVRYGLKDDTLVDVALNESHEVDNRSDHYPFAKLGIIVSLLNELGENSQYHSTRDTEKTMNLEFLARVTRLFLTVLADLAGLSNA